MSEKIVSVKEGKVIEKDDKDWVELVDQDDKTHRIFRSMQNNEGVWVHLDKQVDMLKGKIEDNSIEGLALKLTKEKKGTFWNVIGVEEVKDVFVKEAIQKIAEGPSGQETGMWWKELGEMIRAQDPVALKYKRQYYAQMFSILNLKEAEVETKAPRKTESNKEIPTPETGQLPREEDTGGGEASIKIDTLQALFAWGLSHGKAYTPSWIEKQVGIPRSAMTSPEVILNVYENIKALTGWQD